jgi:hypothetical protein
MAKGGFLCYLCRRCIPTSSDFFALDEFMFDDLPPKSRRTFKYRWDALASCKTVISPHSFEDIKDCVARRYLQLTIRGSVRFLNERGKTSLGKIVEALGTSKAVLRVATRGDIYCKCRETVEANIASALDKGLIWESDEALAQVSERITAALVTRTMYRPIAGLTPHPFGGRSRVAIRKCPNTDLSRGTSRRVRTDE